MQTLFDTDTLAATSDIRNDDMEAVMRDLDLVSFCTS